VGQSWASSSRSLSISDATIVEGDAGTKDAVFTITLGTASTATIFVDAATTTGTADEMDYARVIELLVFDPGETSKEIRVPITGETIPENDETFNVGIVLPEASDGSRVTVSRAIGRRHPERRHHDHSQRAEHY